MRRSPSFSLVLPVIALCLSGSFAAIAQAPDPQFELLRGANGIMLGKINSFSRDKYGAMWFSDQTNGCLTRFDGTRMTRYSNDPGNPNSLGGTYPECQIIDSTGVIWIGFWNGGGLDSFDPETNTFKHYKHDPEDPTSLANDTISALLIDHLGNFWVGTNSGLDLLDVKTGKFTHFKHDPEDSTSLSYDFVRCLYEDSEGTLWVGSGFLWQNEEFKSGGGLNRFDRSTQTFKRFLHDPNDPHTLVNNKVRALYEDRRGNFWIGTAEDGLHSMDLQSGVITRHPYDPTGEEPSRPPTKNKYDHITFITEDSYNRLWIGTYANGILMYDPELRVSNHFSLENGVATGFRDNSAWCAYSDSSGLFWVSTESARLFQVSFPKEIIKHHPTSIGVRSFLEGPSDELWIGTYGGLIKKDLKSGQELRFTSDPLNPNALANNLVLDQLLDSRGDLWVGTYGGLSKWDPDVGGFVNYYTNASNEETISSNIVLDIVEDNHGTLWFATADGLNRWNRDSETFTRYKSRRDSSSLWWNQVFSAIADRDQDVLWLLVAGNSDVIDKFDLKSKKVLRHYVFGESISGIYQDSEGDLWVGGLSDLYKYFPDEDKFLPFGGDNMLLKAPDVISIVEDDDGNLWMNSATTVYKLNLQRDRLTVYGRGGGFDFDELEWRSAHKMQNGNILIASTDGYYSFNPKDFVIPNDKPVINYSELFVNGYLVTPGENSVLTKPLHSVNMLNLSYDERVFSIGVSVIDFLSAGGARVYYRLTGYDKEWKELTGDANVYYFGVDPGSYEFETLTANPLNGIPVRKTLSIVVLPPWWKTVWAYLLFGVTFACGVYGVHRFQKSRVVRAERERNRERELAQAREVEKAYNELKITQSQLIQSEKMASLGELTAGIAHEIQNPLNFVNNFAEVNSELIAEMKEELEKGNIKEARELASGIDENEKKIGYHGKRADGIVKSMLQHSRSSSGKKELTDLNALADEYLRLAFHGLRAKDKSFNAKFQTDLDPAIEKVNVVPQEIGRVFLNLINNAFFSVSEKKAIASNDYEPTVLVRTKKISDKVEIRISDNGNGIPDSVREKIFQPFFTTKPTGQGTGLGLSMSYDIISNAHKGEMRVESKTGEGATFIIVLPTD